MMFIPLSILLIGCGEKTDTKQQYDPAIPVEVEVVNFTDGTNFRHYVGTLKSEVKMSLSFPLGGNLTDIYVHNGQKVKKGAIIAKIDETTAKSMHDMALASLNQAEDGYERLKQVHEEGGISDVRWIQMETDLEKARQAEVAARKRMEDCVIRAPFDGIVSCRNHHVGEEMKPLEVFARVIDMRQLRVEFSVPEHEIGLLPVGATATALIPALDNRELTLRVNDKSLIANPLGHTYMVFASVVGGDTKGLLPDMVAKIHLSLNDRVGMVIPSECVTVMPEGPVVWVVNDGKAYHRAITIGEFVGNGVEVKSGLSDGDTVITLGQQKLYNGAKVVIEN